MTNEKTMNPIYHLNNKKTHIVIIADDSYPLLKN